MMIKRRERTSVRKHREGRMFKLVNPNEFPVKNLDEASLMHLWREDRDVGSLENNEAFESIDLVDDGGI